MTGKRIIPLLILLATLAVLPAPVRSSEEPEAEIKQKVEVLEQGAEPRQLLRYLFKEDGKEVGDLRMKMSMKLAIGGGMPTDMNLPAMTMTMEAENDSISPEGNLKYRFKVTEVGVDEDENADPIVIEAMRTGLENVVGMKGWAILTPRGLTVDSEFTVPEGVDDSVRQAVDSMKQQVNQMSAALPLEPVGIGAKWKVTMPVEAQGISLDNVMIFELVERIGNTVTLNVSLEQDAKRQMMDLPTLPPGATAELLTLKSSGTGTMELDLTRIFPRSEIDLDMTMKALIRVGEEEAPMSMKLRLEADLTPKAITEDD